MDKNNYIKELVQFYIWDKKKDVKKFAETKELEFKILDSNLIHDYFDNDDIDDIRDLEITELTILEKGASERTKIYQETWTDELEDRTIEFNCVYKAFIKN